jgi:hypothetical protein
MNLLAQQTTLNRSQSSHGDLMTRRAFAGLFATILTTTALPGQTLDVPVQPNVVSINPFGFLLEWYSIEYERAFSASASWSVGVGYINHGESNDETTYTSADIRLRYYPAAEAPLRFAAGIALGYSRVTDEDVEMDAVIKDEFDALSLGIDLGYSWLLGRTRQFFLGAGVGAKRLFPIGANDDERIGRPTARLSIGYAF